MKPLFSLTICVLLTALLPGCSVGMALYQKGPASDTDAAARLIQVAEFHEYRGDYEAAQNSYRKAMELIPGESALNQRVSALRRVAEISGGNTAVSPDTSASSDSRSVVSAACDRKLEQVLLGGKTTQRTSPASTRVRSSSLSSRTPALNSDPFQASESDADESMIGRQSPLF